MAAEPRVAIVGLGGLFPPAVNPERLWANVLACADASREVPPGRWLLAVRDALDPGLAVPDRVYSGRGYFLEKIPLDLTGLDVSPDLLAGLDPVFHLTLYAGVQAFRSAVTRSLDPRRVGVVLGNIALPTEKASALARDYLGRTLAEQIQGGEEQGASGTNPFNRYVAGLPAGFLAKALGLGGGSHTLDAACASSLYALKLAVDELQAGRADAMLAGGVSRPDCLYTQMGFSQLRALSPSGRCSPFDARADGLVVGEGAGVFVLKRLEDAQRDGDRIWAVIAGIGLSNDVGGGLLAPSSEGQLRALRAAYRAASWSPSDVDLIECHATGTPVGDAVEFRSLRELWGADGWRRGQCVIGSVKSSVGHLLTAAGSAGLAKVLMAFQAETLPPTANFSNPAPGIDLKESPFQIFTQPRPWPRRSEGTPRRAAISAFGFGGINAHLLLEEAPDSRDPSPGLPNVEGLSRAEALPDGPRPDPCRSRALVPDLKPWANKEKSPLVPAVAIVGMEAQVGPWKGLREFQERVLGGRAGDSPQPPRHWWGTTESLWFRSEGLDATPFAGFYLESLTIPLDRFRIPPRELEELLPQQLLMLQVAAAALEPLALRDEQRLRTGAFIGIGLDLNTTNFHLRWSLLEAARIWSRRQQAESSAEEMAAWASALRDASGPALTANRTMGALGSIVASRIAREFRFGGPSFTLANEECSGLRALEKAVRALQQGELDCVLVGAVDLAGDVRAVLATHAHRPFSRTGLARPFDVGADGPLIGEGAAAVVLKRLADAERDGDPIYALLRGIGVAGGGQVDASVPDRKAYLVALERAYAEARVDPASIHYVEAHGSGQPEEDRIEAEAFAEFFGKERRTVPLTVGSAKADVGHAGAAAGLVSLVKAILCLDRQILPPLRSLREVRPELTSASFSLPRFPAYWLRDRAEGPRRAGVSALGVDGNCIHVVLEAYEPAAHADRVDRLQPLGDHSETLFITSGNDVRDLIDNLDRLHKQLAGLAPCSLTKLARIWHAETPIRSEAALAVALVTGDRDELSAQIDFVRRHLANQPALALPALTTPPAWRDRVFYVPSPLGRTGQLAFVFPGSGNDFPGMGRELATAWPEILRRQDAENERLRSQFVPEHFWQEEATGAADVREKIFGQVAVGTLVSDLLAQFGVRPQAVLGYSLGESAGLFALRAWTDRDRMLAAMRLSTLFVSDLTGPRNAARQTWNLPEGTAVDWVAGVVDRSPEDVRRACADLARVYLLLINAPRECVIGGERCAIAEVVRRLDCNLLPLPHATTVHCPVMEAVAGAYRNLHWLPTTPPPGVRFYAAGFGQAYEVTSETAADAILAQARHMVDFPAVVEAAYRDGVRLFVEIGPGASCTRMIGAILGERPHGARSAMVAGTDGASSILRLLAHLAAERVPLNLDALHDRFYTFSDHNKGKSIISRTIDIRPGGEPFRVPEFPRRTPRSTETRLPPTAPMGPVRADPLLTSAVATQQARGQAHSAYLRFTESVNRSLRNTLALQMSLAEALATQPRSQTGTPSREPPRPLHPAPRPALFLDRAACLEFAVGSVGRVLGPDFAEADSFPTRVRLPDEPLMLVDRILRVEGQPRSLSRGRVVTEHDVRPGAWYLDGGRIPTCIAIEAGQADLFLSGYLGIDFRTRGQAVYRLLDAAVTFHRGLPAPEATIRYDIHIDRFFRQGDTHLFRFRFEGSVDGEPLLTMTDGCAGFFTADELAAGKGLVQTELDRREQPCVHPSDWEEFVPLTTDAFDAGQLEALRRSDLAGCFGPSFAGLDLREPPLLPGGRMRLIDRVTCFDPSGGRYGLGLLRAEADVDPTAWFLTCHFVDDQVMPGTLMYECCLHSLRVFLLRIGWVGERSQFVYEPVPGVTSRLKCRGQITAATGTVTYEIALKELGYRPEPYALADAWMYADGKPIVEIRNVSLRLTGLTREAIRAVWQRRAAPADERKPALVGPERILAFAVGKPSEAFGEPYRVFDEERFIARLPGPPYLFLDRITHLDAEPWRMVADGVVEAQYDVLPDAWYFAADRQSTMPFAVLLEVALQVCGWLAAYAGSALTSPVDLSFRNLEGSARLLAPVPREAGTLTTRVRLTRAASSAGMIVQSYEFTVRSWGRTVYEGTTSFGFFSREALAHQEGIRGMVAYLPSPEESARARAFPFPREAPFPDDRWRMIDQVNALVPDGGPAGLGFIEGTKNVDPLAWFFKAHFYQDPVSPGSLGLESFLQLLKVMAVERWGLASRTGFRVAPGTAHSWTYRGQILPTNRLVTVQAWVTARDDSARRLTADGCLLVDGLLIYRMKDFSLEVLRDQGSGVRSQESGVKNP